MRKTFWLVNFPSNMADSRKEYLTEWPPPPLPNDDDADIHESEDSNRVRGHSDLPPAKKSKPRRRGGHRLGLDEASLAESDPSILAGPLLARWWRLRLRHVSESEVQEGIPASCNPNTLLYHIARLPDAKQFLQHRVEFLQALLSADNPTAHAPLASCYQKLGQYEDAVEHAQLAVKSDQQNKETKWLLELVMRQRTNLERRRKMQHQLQKQATLQMPKPIQVERRQADSLSFKEFFHEYAINRTPLIITGMVEHMTPKPWTLEYIKKVIGHKRGPLKQLVPGSVEWAKLEPAGECNVAQFIDSLDEQGADLRYLFDWSLPLNCPELVKELRIPKYFCNDFLQRTPTGMLYHDSWPSLFIAPAGICSELHVDAFGSNFWMALFEGRKRWVFFPPEDTLCLYPVYEHSTDAIFEVNLACPDLKKFPLLSITHPKECVLEPGELLFVPAGCPHRVENLQKSLAISANFVDLSNFEAVLAELRVNAFVDERAGHLLEVFESEDFCRDVDEVQETLEWEEFKAWPRTIRKPTHV